MENQTEQQQNQQTFTEPKREFMPFSDNVNDKPYSQPTGFVSQDQLSTIIPEPSFQPQSINTRENPYDMLGGDGGGGGSRKNDSAPVNPAMNQASDAEKKAGAEHLATIILDTYEQINSWGNMFLKIPEKKIRKLQAEGELDLSIQVPTADGSTISAGEFIEEFNNQTKDTLVVSREFKKDVKPPLVRILEKRGAGMTDEQYVLFAFGKDIAVKSVLIYQMKSTANDLINALVENTAAIKSSGVVSQPKPSTPKPTEPKPTPTTTYEPTEDFDNFNSNEAVVNSIVVEKQVPTTGKAKLMEQRQKEKIWSENAAKASGGNSSYQEAMKQRKTGGKRGRKPKDYINNIDESEIAEAIILRETDREGKEKPNPQMQGLD